MPLKGSRTATTCAFLGLSFLIMFDIIEFPTGGYGIKMKPFFDVDIDLGKKGRLKYTPIHLYSFTQNKIVELKTDYIGIVPIEFKHNDFNYVIKCIREMSRNFIDPLSEQTLPY